MENKKTPYKSSWETPLPEDEIGRQQKMKESLKSGMMVEILDYGKFRYSGIWDTMHVFYPEEDQILRETLPDSEQRYIRRDLRGNEYLELPYTRLADYIRPLPQQ